MNVRERFLPVLALMCFTGAYAFGLEAKGTAPQGPAHIQGNINTAFNDILRDINKEIEDIDVNPEKLIKGFADASTFSALGATQRAYGEYKLWSFTVGPMVGVRLPGNSFFDIAGDIEDMGNTLEEEGDVRAGLNAQGITGQFGLNVSKLLLENLYLGVRFGYFNLTAIEDLKFETFQIGLTGNYQLLKGFNVVSGLFRWRGVSAGAGLVFQKTTLGYIYQLERQTASIIDGGSIHVDPSVNFDMGINTFIIPLEVNTSAQLLWILNLNLGLGVDVAFGKNTTTLNMSGSITGDEITTPGYLAIDAGGSAGPTLFNPKFMANLGFKFGPVIIDVPLTCYFVGGPGLGVGITLGAVW